jgi:hypothetical protein
MQTDIKKSAQAPAQKPMPGKDQSASSKPSDKMSTDKKGGCGC